LIRDTCSEENIALVIVTHAMEVARQFERVDRLDELNQVVARARNAAV
jgi:putative ABC transport system ATP-binding protein